MVRYEILRDVLIKHAPVARVVVVDRLDVAPNEVLVLLACHGPPPSFAVNATVIAERAEIFDSFDVAVVYAQATGRVDTSRPGQDVLAQIPPVGLLSGR